ncbi:MAG: hypothetical protein CM1200mP2_42940 [Planctomycetaceae bacterium]|nr:MAG: hypothetical protein CM1200mP2_42940 [Planctomycetaceae bacterium]
MRYDILRDVFGVLDSSRRDFDGLECRTATW